MDIKEFKQLSRQNNYRVLNWKMPLASHKRQSLKDVMFAKQYDTLVIKRGSSTIGLIPLAKGHVKVMKLLNLQLIHLKYLSPNLI